MTAPTLTDSRPEVVTRGVPVARKPWIERATSADHKAVGLLYIATALSFLSLAAVEFALMPFALYHFHRSGLYGVAANLVASVIFVFAADLDWRAVVLLATGSVVGGYVGARIGRRLPVPLLRAGVVVAGLVGAFLLWS